MNPIDAKLSRFGHNKMSNFSVAEVTEQIISDTTELILDAMKDTSASSDINNRWAIHKRDYRKRMVH